MILSGGAFGGARGARPVPPEKGIFPLDRMHECDLVEFPSFFTRNQFLLIFMFICFLCPYIKHNKFLNIVWFQLKFRVSFVSLAIFPSFHSCCCCIDVFQEKIEYISCLKSSGNNSEKCRHLSKKYLQCRMDK